VASARWPAFPNRCTIGDCERKISLRPWINTEEKRY
jgi:hypothetical protein